MGAAAAIDGSSSTRHIWLVDPNDGTSAFLRGWRGTAVSIALLRDGLPVLGARHGATSVPTQWRDRLLACRPIAGLAGVHQPRLREYWPVDALQLAERLLVLGERHADKGRKAP